jgi:uncharacterized protein (DUF934 family)
MLMALVRCDVSILDLNSAGLAGLCRAETEIASDVPLADLAGLVPAGSSAVAIRFARFSDGRGFTLARHLREAMGHGGAILGFGHLIPDQADYLRRCGFSHVEIAPGALAQWQRSLSLSPPSMQQILSGRRARNRDMATS